MTFSTSPKIFELVIPGIWSLDMLVEMSFSGPFRPHGAWSRLTPRAAPTMARVVAKGCIFTLDQSIGHILARYLQSSWISDEQSGWALVYMQFRSACGLGKEEREVGEGKAPE